MSSGIGRARSAESSPRTSRAGRKKSPNVEASALALSPIATRTGCGGSQSALQSAWIQRIIPLQRTFVSEDHPELYVKKRIDNMECTDEEEDCQPEVSGFKFDAPSSWLTMRNSEREETEVFPGARISGSRQHSTGLRGKNSVSSDSKVVPVAEDEVISSKFTSAKVVEEQGLEQQHNELLGSAWFARITRKDFSIDGDSNQQQQQQQQQQGLRSFPPLKSGEQWPGTLKPSGLPPLRIPSTRSTERSEQSLPLLTPVAVPPKPRDDSEEDDSNEKEAPSLIRTISLFDSVSASGSSFTCSLPSNFANERSNSDRTKSLQDRFGFINGTVRPSRKNSNASRSSDTKSLFEDEGGEEVQSLSRRDELNTAKTGGKALSRTSIESNIVSYPACCFTFQERSKVPLDQPQPQHDEDLPKYNLRSPPQRERLHNSKSVRGGQMALSFQPGSQQWLHRWCSPSPYKDGARAK
ncbi:hypothetical protein SELMODRAFT_444968 [Selaginella moellendorffii]|uniref:Uncharacterized protein n=1 Tax=Selaginella moellendorffii TaxID=88036 RepID=D8SEA0_SELML|nr:hypothetical protein SELMODRAFT_444968 [Selaginella moellendorffii]